MLCRRSDQGTAYGVTESRRRTGHHDHSASAGRLMAGRPRKAAAKPAKSLEATLWDAADKLRGNLEAAEYKHVVLGLVFLKYVSDAFAARRLKLAR